MTKILIVEDNPANRDMLVRRLQRHGFTTVCAVHGPTGVTMAEAENPDIILMDIALGAMSGWEATKLIKARASTSGIPVIALTAHALSSDRAKSKELGCSEFETKPVDLARLLAKIETCLKQAA